MCPRANPAGATNTRCADMAPGRNYGDALPSLGWRAGWRSGCVQNRQPSTMTTERASPRPSRKRGQPFVDDGFGFGEAAPTRGDSGFLFSQDQAGASPCMSISSTSPVTTVLGTLCVTAPILAIPCRHRYQDGGPHSGSHRWRGLPQTLRKLRGEAL